MVGPFPPEFPVAVTVHGTERPTPLAIQVRGALPDQRVGRALASVDASWPEHFYWVQRAYERGDFWVTERAGEGREPGDVWFFDGDPGAELAGL